MVMPSVKIRIKVITARKKARVIKAIKEIREKVGIKTRVIREKIKPIRGKTRVAMIKVEKEKPLNWQIKG